MKIFQAFLLIITLASCDMVYYVSIQNSTSPKEVKVTYQKHNRGYWDSDSLNVYELETRKKLGKLERTNIDSVSYSFLIDTETEVELMPKEINRLPISYVELELTQDSIWTINVFDKAYMRELKKKGFIKITHSGYQIKIK